MNKIPTAKEMEKAMLNRDVTYDGIFFTAVRTTGIFCRPSCPSRKPDPNNVVFYSTPREALVAGYRPCLRCRPLEIHASSPDWVKDLLCMVEENPDSRLKEHHLREMGIDPDRARRYFLKNYGMTFQAYCRARRMGEAIKQIRQGAAIDDVVLNQGYESHSGFRDAFARTFGKAPGKSRSEECIYLSWYESPIGPLILGANQNGICLLEFSDRRMLETEIEKLRKSFRCTLVPGTNDFIRQLQSELNEYFSGARKKFSVRLQYSGTPFEVQVWNALLQIPYGETRSYQDLAREIGKEAAVRAVGRANGMNKIVIVIPCHRVVNKDGKLGGYGGGLWRKQYLLDLEQGLRQPSLAV